MKEKLRALVGIGKEFNTGMGERNLSIFATSGCYYMFMSLVPVMMILCCILPFTPYNQDMVLNLIDTYFAPSMGDILRGITNAIYRSNSATLTVSILLTLFSASAAMKAVMKGMDAAYKCKNQNNAIVFTIRALIYMVLFVVAILASLIVMVYGGKILSLLRKYLGKVGFLGVLLSKGRYVLVMLILFGIFLLFYTLMPAMKVKVKDQIPGAIFGAVIWVGFSAFFTIYISVSNKFGAYGFIGTVMVAMMWMYYCLYFLLIGGFLNSYLTERKKVVKAVNEPSLEALTVEAFAETGAESVENLEKGENAERVESLEKGVSAESTENIENADTSVVTEPVEVNSSAVGDSENQEAAFSQEVSGDATVESVTSIGGSETVDSGDSKNVVLEEDTVTDSEEQKSKKKLLIPLIAVAMACAIAAIVGAVFLIKAKKRVPNIEIEK